MRIDIWLRRIFITALKTLRVGEITLITPEKETWFFEGKEKGITADITLKNWDVIKNLLLKGDVGLAEDYAAGNWESEDLAALLTLAARNKETLDRLVQRGWAKKRWEQFRDWQNTQAQAAPLMCVQEEVAADFYQILLDASMTYSAAIYDGEEQSLAKAQATKYSRILDAITGAKHVLELGCGWGGFMEAAVQRGATVKGITLSNEQAQFCNDRLKNDAAMVQDFRDETVQYDAVVSVEMLQALPPQEWPIYFSSIKKALKPEGKAIIQAIITTDDMPRDGFFARQKKYFLSEAQLITGAERAGLKVVSTHTFGRDYAKTLGIWLKNMDSQLSVLRELDYSQEIVRSWRFYLAYCESQFTTHHLDVVQVKLRPL